MVCELADTEGLKVRTADDNSDHARRQPSYFGDRRGKTAAFGHALLRSQTLDDDPTC